jgi:ABC-type antimicrobial peptide transport system permease subunit
VFESADPETREINATDKRFFWIALYAQPVLWILLAVLALASLEFIWLTLVGTFILFCGVEGKGNKEGG